MHQLTNRWGHHPPPMEEIAPHLRKEMRWFQSKWIKSLSFWCMCVCLFFSTSISLSDSCLYYTFQSTPGTIHRLSMGSSPEYASLGITWFVEFSWLSFVKAASDGTKKPSSMESPVEKNPQSKLAKQSLGI